MSTSPPAKPARARSGEKRAGAAKAGAQSAEKRAAGAAKSAARGSAEKAGDPWEIVQAEFVAAAGTSSTLPEHGVEVAFAGRSNVGKSSLINALTGRKSLARTGATPGVTRTLIQFTARTRDGRAFALVDLPGYGFAQRSKAERRQWADVIEAYLRGREQLAALVLLVDARRGLEEDDLALIEFTNAPGESVFTNVPGEGAGRPPPEIVIVATKIDKVSRSSQFAAMAAIGSPGGLPAIAWSSVTGQGKSALGRRIALALERAGSRR